MVNDSKKVLVEHDEAEKVFYYRENDPENPEVKRLDLGVVDWLLLAKQKHALVKIVWDDRDHPLWGLVNFIDAIQDSADSQDFPVVWSTDEWEE